MGKRRGGRIVGALLLACFGAVAVPSCVIRIGPGDGSEGSDPTVTDPGVRYRAASPDQTCR
jgi:hypothetical protein